MCPENQSIVKSSSEKTDDNALKSSKRESKSAILAKKTATAFAKMRDGKIAKAKKNAKIARILAASQFVTKKYRAFKTWIDR